jgi:hypothetical protein
LYENRALRRIFEPKRDEENKGVEKTTYRRALCSVLLIIW